MRIERERSTEEADESLTPRERLAKFLKKEEAGSSRRTAFDDMLKLENIVVAMDKCMPLWREGKGNLNEIKSIELIAKKVAVEEAIRNHTIGAKGIRYNRAFIDSNILLSYYIVQATKEDKERPLESAVNAIEADLLKINENKPAPKTQTLTPNLNLTKLLHRVFPTNIP